MKTRGPDATKVWTETSILTRRKIYQYPSNKCQWVPAWQRITVWRPEFREFRNVAHRAVDAFGVVVEDVRAVRGLPVAGPVVAA